jgi:hypothetical protein
LTH